MAVTWGKTIQVGGAYVKIGIEVWYEGDPSSGTVTAWSRYLFSSNKLLYSGYELALSYTCVGSNHSNTYFNNSDNSGEDLNVHLFTPTQLEFEILRVPTTVVTQAGLSKILAYYTDLWDGDGYVWTHWLADTPDVFLTTPAKPYLKPDAPINFSATRTSDTQHTLTWSGNVTTKSNTKYWESVKIDRWDIVSSTWKTVKSLSGTATSWVDKGTNSNNRYKYRVYSYNSGGDSGYTELPSPSFVDTTPQAPSNVVAYRDTETSIKISWTNNALHADTFELQRSVNGGTWTSLGSTTTVAELTDTGLSSSNKYQYRVLARASAAEHYLPTNASSDSSYSLASNLVPALSAPNPPTNLYSSPVFDARESQTFTWTHNSTDTSYQTYYTILFKEVGTETWFPSVVKTQSDSSSHIYVPDPNPENSILKNGKTYVWKVLTYGLSTTGSIYSAEATFTTSERPEVTIITPTEAGVDQALLTTKWSYTDVESTEQAQALIVLRDGGSRIIHTHLENSSIDEYTFPVFLQDNSTYTVEIETRDSSGMWSLKKSVTFYVDYDEPSKPVLMIEIDENKGLADIYVDNPAPIPDVETETNYNEIWRSVDPVVGRLWEEYLEVREEFESTGYTPQDTALINPLVTRTNLIPNPRFIKSSGGKATGFYVPRGTASITDSPWETGYKAQKVVATANAQELLLSVQNNRIPISPGDVVTWLFRLRGTAGKIRCAIDWYDTSVFIKGNGGNVVTPDPNGWYSFSLTVPETVNGKVPVSANFVLVIKNNTTVIGDEIETSQWLVTVSNSTYTGLYFDGSTQDIPGITYTWSGTEDASTSIETNSTIEKYYTEFKNKFELTAIKIADNLSPNSNFTDYIPILAGYNTYWATAISYTPSSKKSDPVLIANTGESDLVYFNGGPDFSQVVAFCGSPKVSDNISRDKVTQYFLGRDRPVEYIGRFVEREIKINGTVHSKDTIRHSGHIQKDFEEIVTGEYPVCFRDCFGRRYFVSIPSFNFTQDNHFVYSISATMTEIDYNA